MVLKSFDNLCPWPRRLLHIKSLRSHEWQPGNIYGEHKSPQYNALSYTWGRWELDKNEQPHIKAIPVLGVSWPIPRIKPEHFTAERFEAVIADSAESHSSDVTASKVEFLWLDVACIDQARGSREKAQEIGRQGKIFKGALRVFVWLTTHDRDFFTSWATTMEPQFELMVGPTFHTTVDKDEWGSKMRHLIKGLLNDPWFSSLWTLQEAFLSPDAVVMPGNAMKNEMDLIRLKFISETFQSIQDALSFNGEMCHVDKIHGLNALIDQTGLCVCLEQNLMGLLTAAGNRTTLHDEDRVYGIMQVFGFQLGNSAPNMHEDRHFSLDELNDQLGTALLEKDPILSQMHIFQDVVAPSRAWRVGRNSIVPWVSRKFYHRKRNQPEVVRRAVLSSQSFNGVIWGIFTGPVLPFRIFAQHLLQDWPNAWFWGGANIQLDRETFDQCPEKDRKTSLSQAMFLVHHKPEVFILLLGFQDDTGQAGDSGHLSAVGLLLHPVTADSADAVTLPAWRRIGLFVWTIDTERSEEEAVRSDEPYKLLSQKLDSSKTTTKRPPYLKGNGSEWELASGRFG